MWRHGKTYPSGLLRCSRIRPTMEPPAIAKATNENGCNRFAISMPASRARRSRSRPASRKKSRIGATASSLLLANEALGLTNFLEFRSLGRAPPRQARLDPPYRATRRRCKFRRRRSKDCRCRGHAIAVPANGWTKIIKSDRKKYRARTGSRSLLPTSKALEAYRRKRDFSKTIEPSGRAARDRAKPDARRFAVQKTAQPLALRSVACDLCDQAMTAGEE